MGLFFHSTSHSLSKKITTRVMVTTMIIMMIITAIIVTITFITTLKVSTERVESQMELFNQKFNNSLEKVELIMANTIPDVEYNKEHPEIFYNLQQTLMENHPFIIGTATAFVPNYFPEKGELYSPYTYRGPDSLLHSKQLGTPEYYYPDMEWFSVPIKQKKSNWSEPYFDKGGGEQMMTTYSCPVYDESGNIYAVITADISLEWITQILMRNDMQLNQNLRVFKDDSRTPEDSDFFDNHPFTFILGKTGAFISHPDKNRLLTSNFFDYAKKTKTTVDDEVGYKMLRGEKGTSTIEYDGMNVTLVYSPIEHTGWSMTTIIPSFLLLIWPATMGLIIVIFMLICLAILFFICHSNVKEVTTPLTQFAQSAEEIAKGHFDASLPEINTMDEMKQLHDSFYLMQHSLTDYMEKLKTANEQKGRLEGELQAAKRIQSAMVPKTFPPFPTRKDIDVYAFLAPAKEVGGDLYDYFIRDEKLFFCVADVSGKGIPGSLLMAVTRSMFRSAASRESFPAQITENISHTLSENNENMMFVTAFVGVLDLPTGKLRYCNAGHCAPLLIDTDVTKLPVTPNIAMGIMDYKFQQQETMIKPGTTLFLYTDGLTEAENKEYQEFEMSRVIETAKHCIDEKKINPEYIINKMEKTVLEFTDGAAQNDDRTMLAIQYSKENEETKLQRSITLPNDVERIPELNAFISDICEELGIDMSETMSLNLAIEEAVVNVMDYAYPKGITGDVKIEVMANDNRFNIVISDSGSPFDPTSLGPVDTTLSAEDRPIGGLGFHLVREIMDSINYDYSDHKNILTISKNI